MDRANGRRGREYRVSEASSYLAGQVVTVLSASTLGETPFYLVRTGTGKRAYLPAEMLRPYRISICDTTPDTGRKG